MGEIKQFQVGDLVRIREWDDMEAEFGINFEGNIDCMSVFTKEMKQFCGEEFVINRINHSKIYEHPFDGYFISIDMVELVEDTTDFDTTNIEDFLYRFAGVT